MTIKQLKYKANEVSLYNFDLCILNFEFARP